MTVRLSPREESCRVLYSSLPFRWAIPSLRFHRKILRRRREIPRNGFRANWRRFALSAASHQGVIVSRRTPRPTPSLLNNATEGLPSASTPLSNRSHYDRFRLSLSLSHSEDAPTLRLWMKFSRTKVSEDYLNRAEFFEVRLCALFFCLMNLW